MNGIVSMLALCSGDKSESLILSFCEKLSKAPPPGRRSRTASISRGDNFGPDVRMAGSPVAQLECKICLDKKINTVILPCGHACCCRECAVQLQYATWESTCPICRTKINAIS